MAKNFHKPLGGGRKTVPWLKVPVFEAMVLVVEMNFVHEYTLAQARGISGMRNLATARTLLIRVIMSKEKMQPPPCTLMHRYVKYALIHK